MSSVSPRYNGSPETSLLNHHNSIRCVPKYALSHLCVYSCGFYIFNSKNRMASPDLSDFLAADVCWYEHQADVCMVFSVGPVVFENTVRLGSGRRTRSSASVHTPASHPRPSSYSLLSSQSLCQTHITNIQENYTLFLVFNYSFTLQPL